MWRLVALPVAGGLELHDSLGPFQPRPFCECVVQCHGSISSFPGTTRRPDSLKASCLLSSIILPAKIVYQNWLLADITYSSFFFSTEKEVQCDPCWADSQVSFLTASHNSYHEAGLHKENTADNIWHNTSAVWGIITSTLIDNTTQLPFTFPQQILLVLLPQFFPCWGFLPH